MPLILEIPSDVVAALRLPPAEAEKVIRKELALALYQRGVLPVGKARLLAGMTRREFKEALGERGIERHYGLAELQDDMAYAKGLYDDWDDPGVDEAYERVLKDD